MAEQTIVGVDFSGAINGDPWVTTAVLKETGLNLESCFPLPREELTERLLALSGDANAVVGMDFPFGVPKLFAETEFGFKGTLMPQMWNIVSNLDDLPKYIKEIRPRLRKEGDLSRFNKLLREGDSRHFPEAYSPLNPASPEMFPMTFHGMSMLHTLWTNSGCRVPPLSNAERSGAVLLETMPGAVLSRVGFEWRVHKNYKNGVRARSLRKEIMHEIESKTKVPLQNLDHFRDLCIGIHDCLDSLVAATAAAMWARDKTSFHRPEDHQDQTVLEDAQLEGWIYAPKK